MIPNLSEHLFDKNQIPVPLLSAVELLKLEKEMIKVREVHFYSALNSWIEMTAEVLSLHPSIFDATIKLSDTLDECMGWVYQPFELRSDNYLPCYGVCYFPNKQTGTQAKMHCYIPTYGNVIDPITHGMISKDKDISSLPFHDGDTETELTYSIPFIKKDLEQKFQPILTPIQKNLISNIQNLNAEDEHLFFYDTANLISNLLLHKNWVGISMLKEKLYFLGMDLPETESKESDEFYGIYEDLIKEPSGFLKQEEVYSLIRRLQTFLSKHETTR